MIRGPLLGLRIVLRYGSVLFLLNCPKKYWKTMVLYQAGNKVRTLSETSPTYLTEHLIDFKAGPDVSQSVKQYMAECRDIVCRKMDEGFPASRVVRLQSLMVDQLILALYRLGFEESQAHGVLPIPLALFALGGYGRAELNLYSDIDLLFVYEGKQSVQLETIIKKMLYPLWDAQVEVGYATRTLQDCKKVMQNDVRAMSSMLDARFLGGDRELGEKFFHFLESRFAPAKALKHFAQAKGFETEDRLKRFGGSVYVLEPNLKESEGGLRDWHLLRYYARIALKTDSIDEWISRDLIDNEEADELDRALNFLWELRNRLHKRLGRNMDQLSFEMQKPIALEMGFTDGTEMLGVERFMQVYYAHAANLHRLLTEISRRLLKPALSPLQLIKRRFKTSLNEHFWSFEGRVIPKNYADLEKNPVELLRAFHLAQENQLLVDEDYKSWLSRHLNLVDEAWRRHPEVQKMFQEMFADLSGIGKSLWEMYEARFLGALIPEFGDILFQPQHDVYHVYPVDSHSILAVQELSKLKNGAYDQEFPVFKSVMEEISNPGVLSLSVLFHDIGKGKGGSHSEKGAILAQTITERMGYSPEDREEVEFLVRSHLLMPHLSQRRDLEDANLIAAFARSMGTLDRLHGLFVLTWADIRAVGPDVWTPWKGTLLQELYRKTRAVLEKGESGIERAVDVKEQIQEKILEMADETVDRSALQAFLNGMPPRYFLAVKPKRILKHFDLLQYLSPDGLLFNHSDDPKKNLTRILIYTLNTPRLFEQVTGVMAANQVNILAFEQFFNSKGEALLLLKVTDQQGKCLEEERRLKALEEDLRQVQQGKISLDRYLQLHPRQQFFRKKMAAKPPRVEIDNDVSAYYTVIDIYANDRIGLLNDLARAMTQLGLYIEVSKISTKVDQVADVFYVKDIFGHKVKEAQKIRAIKDTLLKALEEESLTQASVT